MPRMFRAILRLTLMAAGTVLVFLGARDLIESQLGQRAAAGAYPSAAVQRLSSTPTIHRGDTVAKLSIPRLDTELYVIEGDDARELRRGPGHLPGTAMPGAAGNVVIAGHRDTHFRVLKDIHKGDEIILQSGGNDYRYRVTGASVVHPSDTASLKPSRQPVLHLITCYPFYWAGSAPERFVVEAVLSQTTARLE